MPGWRTATNCLINSNHWTVRKLWVALNVTLFLVSYACMVKVYAAPQRQSTTPDAFWIDVSIGAYIYPARLTNLTPAATVVDGEGRQPRTAAFGY